MNLGPPERPRVPGSDPAFYYHPKGERVGFAAWQLHTREWLQWYGARPERADRITRCGTGIQVPVCKRCGVEDRDSARRTADCEMRICPRCARQAAQQRRECIRAAFVKYQPFKNGFWHLHTIPVHYPRDGGTTLARLRYDFDSAWKAFRAAWKFLKARGAQIAYASAECAPGGLVHVHAMIWHPYVSGSAFAALRETVLGALARRGHRAEQYHVAKVTLRKHPKTGEATYRHAIAEVAKYVTKGVAIEEYDRSGNLPRQTHPGLSAQIERAWKGRRVWRIYGEDAPRAAEEKDEKWQCPNCGHKEHLLRYEIPSSAPAELAALVRALTLAAASRFA